MKVHGLRIARIVEETPDARSLVLEIPRSLADSFQYRAGQFLTFQVPWQGSTLIRCYSLASSPDVEPEHKVTVKRVDEGRVSNWFHDALQPGDTLQVLPPAGRFLLRDEPDPLLFFAGGSGITPVISLIKTALGTGERRARLFYANRDAVSVIFRQELEALVREHPDRLQVVHHLDSESGFAGPAQVREALTGFEDAHHYICGPTPFMDLVEEVLADKGTPRSHISIERFESPADGEAPQVALSGDPAETPSEIAIHLEGQLHRVPYQRGQTILQAVRAAGLQPPFACEEGYCGSCAAKCGVGEVAMAANDVFEADELAEGWILTCQGRVSGTVCEVDYDA